MPLAEDLDNSGDDSIVSSEISNSNKFANEWMAGYKGMSAEVSMAPMSTVEDSNADTAKQLLRLPRISKA